MYVCTDDAIKGSQQKFRGGFFLDWSVFAVFVRQEKKISAEYCWR
jgi:hypothetical protein